MPSYPLRNVVVSLGVFIGSGLAGCGDDDTRDESSRDARPDALTAAADASADGSIDAGGRVDGAAGDSGSDGTTDSGTAARELTFFAWGDLHVDPAVENDGHMRAVEGATAMVGKPWPDPLTGVIAAPELVIDTGDAVDWPSFGATEEYARVLDEDVPWPVQPVLGNHDLTEAGRSTYERWFLERFGDAAAQPAEDATMGADVGARSYAFMRGGVAFVALSHSYQVDLGSPSQPIWPSDLAWLADALAGIPAPVPIVIYFHLGVTAIEDIDDLTAVFEGHRVVLVVGGHYHFPFTQRVNGYDFIQVGSPRPSEDNAMVNVAVRITGDRLSAAFYDYEHEAFRADLTLDKTL